MRETLRALTESDRKRGDRAVMMGSREGDGESKTSVVADSHIYGISDKQREREEFPEGPHAINASTTTLQSKFFFHGTRYSHRGTRQFSAFPFNHLERSPCRCFPKSHFHGSRLQYLREFFAAEIKLPGREKTEEGTHGDSLQFHE